MTKHFIFCENTEGGMDTEHFSKPSEFPTVYGWMSDGCRNEDLALLEWIDTASIGDFIEYRLGVIVRLKDTCATVDNKTPRNRNDT